MGWNPTIKSVPIGGADLNAETAKEPVLFGAVVPESRSEKLIRAEVEGVPFEVVVSRP